MTLIKIALIKNLIPPKTAQVKSMALQIDLINLSFKC